MLEDTLARALNLAVVFSLVVLFASPAAADPSAGIPAQDELGSMFGEQPPAPAEEVRGTAASSGRVLGGHTFVFPGSFQPAFVTTHFGFQQGIASLSAPGIPLTETEKFDLKAFGVVESFDFGAAIFDNVGLILQGEGSAIVGANGDSATLIGGLGNFAGAFGPIWSFLRTDSTVVSVFGQLTYGKGLHVSPMAYVNSVMSGGGLGDTDSLLNTSGKSGFQGGISAAQGLGDLLGVQLSVQYSAATEKQEDEEDDDKWLWVSGTASLDLNRSAGIPTALAFEYSHQMDRVEDETQKLVGGALNYSGREDLQLGIFLGSMLFDENESFPEGRSFFYGKFTMRYFF